MRTELLGQEKNIVRIKVEFEAAEFMSNLSDTIREIAQKANIPGFRKGRTPRKIIEMRFGRDNLYREVLDKILPEAMRQVTDDYDLDIMGTPSLNIGDIKEGEPVSCELIIEVKPEIELPALEDVEVERLRQEVTDDSIDEMTAEFRKQFATLNPVDRAAGENDVVSASFVTRVINPGEELDEEKSPAGEPQPSDIDLSEPSVRAEVKNVLLGKSKGDEVSTEFDVESDYRDASLAGKRVRYDIKINDVNEKILPEIGPEFFKKVMGTDIGSEDEFREEMKKRLLKHKEDEETVRVSERAAAAIVAGSKLDVPDSLLARQSVYQKEQDAADVKQRFNVGMEDYLNQISVAPAQYEQDVQKKAEASLRRTLVMDEIAKNSGLEVKREEIEAEITRMAAAYGMERAKLRAYYYKEESRMSQLENALLYSKIEDLILEKIKIKEVDKLSQEPEGIAPLSIAQEGEAQGNDANESNANESSAPAESAE